MYVLHSLLGTKKMDSLLNSRAGKAPQGLRQKHLSHQCQKQQDSLFDRAQPSLELTFLLRHKPSEHFDISPHDFYYMYKLSNIRLQIVP